MGVTSRCGFQHASEERPLVVVQAAEVERLRVALLAVVVDRDRAGAAVLDEVDGEVERYR